MSDGLTPDICVIGAGSGGLSVAAAAAAFGVPVVLIERAAMGGECLNAGCVPSKALIAAAEMVDSAQRARLFGIELGTPRVDAAKVAAHVQAVIAAIAPNDSQSRFSALGVTVIKAEARFIDGRTLEAGGTRVRARRFVIATGSSPALPPVRGLDALPYLTNETIFARDSTPDHLVVIGGGPVGCELAQAHRRLGARVTILQSGNLLAREDREAAGFVAARLRHEGVEIFENAHLIDAHGAASGSIILRASIDGTERHFGASHVLVAAGRRPNVAGLGLEAAGVAFDPASGIAVSAKLRTSNRRIYAIGDCAGGGTGGLRFTHAAGHQAGIVIRNVLFRQGARFDPAMVPRVTFTDPQIASLGLGEDEAFARDAKARILRWPFSENDRAQALRQTEGEIKLMADRRGRILGVTIVGTQAGELLPLWSLALAKRARLSDIAGLMIPYPTLNEVSRRAAVSALAPAAGNPWVRRAISFLRRFG